MPRHKKKNEPRPKHPIESAPPEQQHKMVVGILKEIMFHMDRQNKSRELIIEFQKECGSEVVSQMSKKDRAKAKALYEQHVKDMVESSLFLQEHLSMMKDWRENAVDAARDAQSLNAIELLKLRVGCQQIWDPKTQPDGHGVAGMGWPDDKRPEKGEEVAAFVDETKTWILAEVIGSVSNHRYECVDVDDQDRKVAVFARKQLIPMPHYTVHYGQYPNMALPKNAIVLALYPGTTCFYEGLVHTPPKKASDFYLIRFTDNQRPDKYSDPLSVPDRYVVAFKKDPVIYVRPSKRAQLGLETPERSNAKKIDGKQNKNKKADERKVIDDRDVPGPAPPAPVYNTDQETSMFKVPKSRSKSTDKKKSKALDKPKIKRAKIPPHKKFISTRQFGKRRVKRKPKNLAPSTSAAVEQPMEEPQKDLSKTEEAKDEKPSTSQLDEEEFDPERVVLKGLARFGLEEEQSDSDSDDEVKRDVVRSEKKEAHKEIKEGDLDEEDEDEDEDEEIDDDKNHTDDKTVEKDEAGRDNEASSSGIAEAAKKDDFVAEKSAESEEVDEEKEEKDQEKANEDMKNEEEQSCMDKSKDDKIKEVEDEMKKETPTREETPAKEESEEKEETPKPHDPEEGTSGPTRYPYDSDSDAEYGTIRRLSTSSDSSDAQSGISVSDNERNRRASDSDDE